MSLTFSKQWWHLASTRRPTHKNQQTSAHTYSSMLFLCRFFLDSDSFSAEFVKYRTEPSPKNFLTFCSEPKHCFISFGTPSLTIMLGMKLFQVLTCPCVFKALHWTEQYKTLVATSPNPSCTCHWTKLELLSISISNHNHLQILGARCPLIDRIKTFLEAIHRLCHHKFTDCYWVCLHFF